MAAQRWKGMSDGVTTEWTIIAKVKPGQEQALRDFGKSQLREDKDTGGTEEFVIPVGTVHDYRWVIFENGARVMFMSNFDGDWGQYIDDFFAVKSVGEGFDTVFSFCEGYDRTASVDAKKQWMQARTQQAVWYARAYHGTVKEMWKALEVQEAFQKVLDDPAAVKALTQTPALKPLLDQAAK